ncbi:MAG: hypothetical protein KGH78_05500, partial [Candidatus Micrarchaeota archaeon]|nr:hypothetical protein [Candidatus Micrarchaeota archaeon]
YSGQLGNMQVYNSQLTANQVLQLYNQGISSLPLPNNALVGYWPLNGNANDYSGNGNNGVILPPLIFSAAAQIFASVKNAAGQAAANTLVGFTTTFANFSNGVGSQQAQSTYTNSNGVASVFLSQQGNNGQAFVKATAMNGNFLPAANIVGWYPLNLGQGGTAYDISGNKNNG